jgi:transketolase
MSDINSAVLQKMSNTLKFLAVDMIESANSGHPGAPMGLSDILSVLSHKLNHNPKNPNWLNRDRLVFSGGHASALVYSWLHLSGYDLSLDELKNFRQFGSQTPGHPEKGHPIGVEITTGPLGQGVANAVGFSMASKYMQNMLGSEAIDHKVYCFCGDGDMQEGIGYEAFSIAGRQALDNLVVIYDDNNITIEGECGISFCEDVTKRFEAQMWDVVTIDGHDYAQIDSALEKANSQSKPLLIIAKTKIAKGAASKEGSHKTHGAPLGAEEVEASKSLAGLDPKKSFQIDSDAKKAFEEAVEKGERLQREWESNIGVETKAKIVSLLKPDISQIEFPSFEVGSGVATRDSNGKIINAISKALPGFIGGSADLAPSNKTELEGAGEFPKGKNIRYGIREHAMAAITNAIAAYGGLLPFCSTFFVFSDYQTPACRMAAIMKLKNFFIWTHDSIGVGEDGATHQPIEHLTQIRALPDFYTYRPADANENIECWKDAFSKNGPCGFVLTRQKLPVLDTTPKVGSLSQGGYIIKKANDAKVTIIATGSEVSTSLEAAKLLESRGIPTSVASVPCFESFIHQDESYYKELFGDSFVVAVEAGRALEWYRFAKLVIGIDSFGMSAPADKVFDHFGFTPEKISDKIAQNI